MERYILSFDQSTSTTKALLFNQDGRLVARSDRAHRQIVDDRGWVEHDGEEIISNLYAATKLLFEQHKDIKSGVGPIHSLNYLNVMIMIKADSALRIMFLTHFMNCKDKDSPLRQE